MTSKRSVLATLFMVVSLSACELDPPPSPRGIDCNRDRAAERYPEACGDAGDDDSGSDQ